MPKPKVSVGLVTWNSAEHLHACLSALQKQTDTDYELIVVDNASHDDSLGLVRQYFPSAMVIVNQCNSGFCHAHNQAIRASKGCYYLPLNPDVVMQSGYIAAMTDALEEHTECGSAAGKLLQGPGVIDSTGLFINRRRQQYLRGHRETDHGQYETPGEIFGVDGAAPLYRRAMLEDTKIDGQYFDELFFAHKEDVDLAWRARLLGWSCWYQPTAVAFHKRTFKPKQRNTVSPEVRMDAVKNRYLLLLKNESVRGLGRDGLHMLWYDFKILAYLCLVERSSLKAAIHIWKALPKVLADRREIAMRTRVKPAVFLQWIK